MVKKKNNIKNNAPKSRAMIFIIALLLIIGGGYFIYSAFLVENTISHTPTGTNTTTQPEQQGTLEILGIYFGNNQYGLLVYGARVGEYVPVYAHIRARNGSAQGVVKIEIRKDYFALPDSTFATLKNTVSVNNGETKDVLIGGFVPDTITGNLVPRGYFGRAYLNENLVYDPQDPFKRPRVDVFSDDR